MDIEQALTNLRAVCASFQGDLAQHQLLQQSLEVVASACRSEDGDGLAAVS